MRGTAPIMLDCTRMVASRWAGRMPTGIDRVCEAYRLHFAPRAQAVVQLHGRVRVLSEAHSARMFDLLENPGPGFRQRLAALAARVLASSPVSTRKGLYLNVSHSDFDLARHLRWVRASGVRPVYLLHDLIPIEHPEFTTAHKTARHAGRVRHALSAASGIITNSRDTARAIRAFAREEGLAPPPLLEAALGTPDLPDPGDRIPARTPVFVCLSTIEHRKNHMLLFDVWQRLIASMGERTPRLMLIGRWGVGGEAVQRRYRADPQLRHFITIHSHCSDADVARHLRTARALLAPSWAEGFGLPVAEALRLGVPVIASDLPAFREAGGTVPTFLDPGTTEAWLHMVREFVADGPERKRQLAALKAWRAPDWRDHFALVDNWLESLNRKAWNAAPDVPCADNDRHHQPSTDSAQAGGLR